MANDNQFKLRTQFIATRGVKEYRATIPSIVTAQDIVLELGCEWGSTTQLIAQQGAEVIGTDISPECIQRARQMRPTLRFEVLDAFDVRAALDLGRAFTKVYMDLSGFSGYRSLLDAIALMNMYATVLRPETIVIKSGSVKLFAAHCYAWSLKDTAQREAQPEE
ncbi:MAG: class I SAM-dependent methyltransferase [Anaerolineae bacterium]